MSLINILNHQYFMNLIHKFNIIDSEPLLYWLLLLVRLMLLLLVRLLLLLLIRLLLLVRLLLLIRLMIWFSEVSILFISSSI
jgi:hypothetical protein